jgi:hypothetical protein
MKKQIYILLLVTITSITATAGTVSVSTQNNTALPVSKNELLTGIQIKATVVNNIGQLSWNARRQKNVCMYQLEKSTDGQHFTYVTSMASNYYNYIAQDRVLMEGINYYRLKIISKDSSFYFSNVTILDTKSFNKAVTILPTVVSDKLHVWMADNTSIRSAVITDAAGKKQQESAVISNTLNLADIDTASLNAGYYAVKLTTNKGEIINHQFMKK